VNVGFVGVGAVAQHHLSFIAKRDDVSVVAVGDLDERRARSVADATGATAYEDWRSMLNGEELDAVFVCTPPEAHAEPTVAALRAGIPVYVEKPLARVLDDGLAIVSAWDGSGVVCAVGYQWRSLDLLSDVQAALNGASPGLLVSRSIGPTEPARTDLAASDPLTGDRWFADPERGGGILFELGSHDIDLQLAIAGPVESVQAAAAGGLLALAGRPATGLQDAVTAALRFSSGGLGTIQVAWTGAQEPPLYTLDVVAAEASLHVELDPVFRLDGRTEAGVVSAVGRTHPRESTLTQFFNAVTRGDRGAVPCSPSDALSTLQVTLACERAIATGQSVAVDDVPEQP
jgi:myo-inositol 2-dehydrogenase/D-chiro-inositol 1-dehydrogenase